MKYFTKKMCIEVFNYDLKAQAALDANDIHQYNLISSACEEIWKSASREYQKYWQSAKDKFPCNFEFMKVNMHDSIITNTYTEGKNFILEIDSTVGFTNVCKLIFEKATVKQFVFRPEMDWQYTEIYILDGQYDIQFLTQCGLNIFDENEIIADNIVVEREYRDYTAIAKEAMKKVARLKAMSRDEMFLEMDDAIKRRSSKRGDN